MGDCESNGARSCGWLMLIAGVFALATATLLWLLRVELAGPGGETRVWVTESGTRYHRRDCRTLTHSAPQHVSLEQAHADGLEPCGLCKPPV